MPLSEHEQRLLDQMEQALYAEDPKFATSLGKESGSSPDRRRLLIGGAVLVAGLALVVVGVMSQLIWVGVIGFVVMVAGGGYALAPQRRSLGAVQDDGSVRPAGRTTRRRKASGATASTGGQHGFMDKLEERWERRRRGDGW